MTAGSCRQLWPSQAWCGGGMPRSNSVTRSTSPVIRMPPASSDGCRRSMTSNPSRSRAPRDSVGISRARRRAAPGGCGSRPPDERSAAGRTGRAAGPGRGSRPRDRSARGSAPRPACRRRRCRGRSALTASPSGETPVSNSSGGGRCRTRTVTRAEKPCSARRPGDGLARGELRRGDPAGAHRAAGSRRPPEASSASKTLSTRVSDRDLVDLRQGHRVDRPTRPRTGGRSEFVQNDQCDRTPG